jgi:chemotaxis protein MotA
MFAIIGILVVFGAVAGGYLMEKGNLLVLMQPAELLIITGAAAGTVLIANPPRVLTAILKSIAGAFTGSRYNKAWHLDSLKLLFEFFDQARRSGLASLEAEVEDASKSKTFARHPAILKDHHVCAFICDTFRVTMIGGIEPFDVDQMLETDIDAHHHEGTQQVSALTTVADSLPGLGIVAAVLGVVITMGSLGGKPEEIGHKVAAALVGTFLGILLCYGLIGPLASSMAKNLESERAYYQMLRVALSAFTKGIPPLLAVEAGRRSIPTHARPSFSEVESTCRQRAPEAQQEAA